MFKAVRPYRNLAAIESAFVPFSKMYRLRHGERCDGAHGRTTLTRRKSIQARIVRKRYCLG